MKIIKIINKINIIFFLILIIILFNSICYAKGVHIRSYSSTKINTSKNISIKSNISSIKNVKGFNSSLTTSTTLIPNLIPFLFLMHGNNYNINGEEKKIDYTLSNNIIKLINNND